MSAVYDFITGTSPQIDPHLCRERRIGEDRVWRVATFLLSHARASSGNTIYTSRAYVAKALGLHERRVREAIEVLEGSNILVRTGFLTHPKGTTWASVHWAPTWEVSDTHLPIQLETITISPEHCRQHGVGVDRTWRIAVLWNCLKSASVDLLARLSGIGHREVRRALAATGLTVVVGKVLAAWRGRATGRSLSTKRTPFRADPGHDSPLQASKPPQSYPPSGSNPEPARSARIENPLKRLRTLQRVKFGGKLMPWDIFSDGVTPDEGVIPTKELTPSRSPKTPKAHRALRPVETWSPLDSAREFKEQFLLRYPGVPGSTGDTAQIAKILGKMRKDYGHDARTEMVVLREWLNDVADVTIRGVGVPAWRKWLYAFQHHYEKAESVVSWKDPKYTTLRGRHHRDVVKPQEDALLEEERERTNKGPLAQYAQKAREEKQRKEQQRREENGHQ